MSESQARRRGGFSCMPFSSMAMKRGSLGPFSKGGNFKEDRRFESPLHQRVRCERLFPGLDLCDRDAGVRKRTELSAATPAASGRHAWRESVRPDRVGPPFKYNEL